MDWSNDTLCGAVYLFLTTNDQVDQSLLFTDVPALTMNQLQFYNVLGGDTIAGNAQAMAMEMNQTFNNNYNVTYTPGNTADSSTAAMLQCLVNPDSTVADLAGVVSTCYIFS